jgi:hypothetical protein
VRQDPALEQEWLRQNNLSYGGLIAIGVFMVQPFLTAGSLDVAARICILAFAVAIPLLAALMLHSAGYWRLERDQQPTLRDAEGPATPSPSRSGPAGLIGVLAGREPAWCSEAPRSRGDRAGAAARPRSRLG